MRTNLLDWLRKALCLGFVGITLATSGCAWVRAGEEPGEPISVKDGQDESQMDVDGPMESNDSVPPVNELP